jgi:hypothetical protein
VVLSAELLAFVATGAFVAALLVSLPAAPALGSVVAVPPDPPWQPVSSNASATPITHSISLRLVFFAFIVLPFVVVQVLEVLLDSASDETRQHAQCHRKIAHLFEEFQKGSNRLNCRFLAATNNKSRTLKPENLFGRNEFYRSTRPCSNREDETGLVELVPPFCGNRKLPPEFYSAVCCWRAFLLSSMTLASASRGISS